MPLIPCLQQDAGERGQDATGVVSWVTCETVALRIIVGVPHHGILAILPGLQHTVCIEKKILALDVPHLVRDSDVGEDDFGVLYEANPVQAATEDKRQHHQQVLWINGRVAQGLRDMGATITLVQPQLVRKTEKIGHSVAVWVAGGHMYRIATARGHLDWGAGDRETEVGLMWDFPAEVLLGKDLGLLTSAFTPAAENKVYPVPTQLQAWEAASGKTH